MQICGRGPGCEAAVSEGGSVVGGRMERGRVLVGRGGGGSRNEPGPVDGGRLISSQVVQVRGGRDVLLGVGV